ncbi:hypothetical protein [Jiella sonneratiae]|uniref:Argininosuccinate lyase n=1 Tax=Jiella sonneratiae TaxID=2816856 RepID=A0ABS3J2I5_9HYPH|nr:hypothetical protein [Jiella sonneratiae]MBO0903858.1 hypothetical protein [Jiella sonneratiae]
MATTRTATGIILAASLAGCAASVPPRETDAPSARQRIDRETPSGGLVPGQIPKAGLVPHD